MADTTESNVNYRQQGEMNLVAADRSLFIVNLAQPVASDPTLADASATSSTDSIMQRLNATANPTGETLSCCELLRLLDDRSNQACLQRAIQLLVQECHLDQDDCNQRWRSIANIIAHRFESEVIKGTLQAHVGCYTTTKLASIQLASDQELTGFFAVQQAAIENGLPVQDPSALERLRLQLLDAAVQTINANEQARSTLSILTKSPSACNYRPALDPMRYAYPQDLCMAIQEAQQARWELRLLMCLRAIIKDSDQQQCLQCASIVSSLFQIPNFCGCSKKTTLLAKLIHHCDIDQTRAALITAICSLENTIKEKVALEVTDAWYTSNTAIERLEIAKQYQAATLNRKQQLAKVAREITSKPETIIEASLSNTKAEVDTAMRERELHEALIELAHVSGKL
jgi:hypothetical protein